MTSRGMSVGIVLLTSLLAACSGITAKLHDNSWIAENSTGSWACFLGFQLDGDLRRNCESAAGTEWLDLKWALDGDRIRLTFADGKEQTCSLSVEDVSIVFGPGCVHQGRWLTYDEFKRRTGRS
jgi:hypothetical protein